jgi:DNA modification methylase
MVAMVTKTLKKMEVALGFIQIPAESRIDLVGSRSVPFLTKLNNMPARVDKYGRLWSSFLKNRYPVGTNVAINKSNGTFQITVDEQERESTASEIMQRRENASLITNSADKNDLWYKVLEGDCVNYLNDGSIHEVNLTFFDPPYRQGKNYRFFDDSQPDEKYWNWTKEILARVYEATLDGGAVYFMQREKNAEKVLRVLRKTGWRFQNLIIWKKKTSAVPCETRFSKQYQIIAYAIKGNKPRVFNKLRIDLPPLPEHKFERENGVYLTDVWDDIRELTSGFFAGEEALRDSEGNRVHVQQSPKALLLRIILSSTLPGDTVFDPCAGTGTTLMVAKQLKRNSIGVEIDPAHVELIKRRLDVLRAADDISCYYNYYDFTPNLGELWPSEKVTAEQKKLL